MVEPTKLLSHNNYNSAQKCTKNSGTSERSLVISKEIGINITVNRMQIPHKSGLFSSIFVKHYTILFFKTYFLSFF
jgi:hypothetical protein